MLRFTKNLILVGLTALLIACEPTTTPTESQPLSVTSSTNVQATDLPIIPSTDQAPTTSAQPEAAPTTDSGFIANDYDQCGVGSLVEVPFYFPDINGQISPTQIMRKRTTDDGVREYVSLSTCLQKDEGWKSDPEEVVNGYENVILFFDKYGRAHAYRIIIGGHYVAPYDASHKDITASLNGVDDKYFDVQEWIEITRERFVSSGTRQIGLDLYISDTQGNLSQVLEQVYKFREINLQIQRALDNGEGYPETVPEDFFLFATKAWLINPE